MTTIEYIENIRTNRNAVAVALIDPDAQSDDKLKLIIDLINLSDFDVIFVGGSMISDDQFDKRIKLINNNTSLPVILFPGSSNQVSKHADAILYLSLISGRNPQYLIDEHVKSAPIIYQLSIEVIPTAYILIDGGQRSSVEVVSNTKPLPMDKPDIIIAHALAGQYLGKSMIFLENGSGALNHISNEIIHNLKSYIKIPIIVGGGIRTPASALELVKAGADYIVAGTKIEEIPNKYDLIKFTDAIHGN